MRYRILVVDDEEEIVSFIQEAMEDEGYEVLTTYNGDDAIQVAMLNKPNLILLDVMLPGRSGFEVCQAIRDVVSCPIVFLSAREREIDRIKGLTVGGDDYLLKPFGIKELKARVLAHLRREERNQLEPRSHVLRYGDLIINLKDYTVIFHNETLPFTRLEFEIIQLLASHYGQVFNKEQIYEKVWGMDADGDSSTVTEHVKKIRHKLSIMDPERQYISTIWGVGYKWVIVNSI